MRRHCEATELMTRSGVGMTPLRELILKIMVRTARTMTPQEILKKARKEHAIDKVTLYRILDLFVSKKILRRIATFKGPLLYEVICQRHFPIHPHFICCDCGDVECLEDLKVETMVSWKRWFQHLNYGNIDLKFEGVCESCQQKL